MLINILNISLYIACICYGLHVIKIDKDFEIQLNKIEWLWLCAVGVLVISSICYVSSIVAAFISVGAAYLQISAITDKHTQLVYLHPQWALLTLSILLESVSCKHFSYNTAIIFMFVYFMGMMKMFGKGDVPMSFVGGAAFYLCFPEQGLLMALMFECGMIIVAQVIFYIKNVREHNMETIFKLKESRPLGPSILTATIISYIAYIAYAMR